MNVEDFSGIVNQAFGQPGNPPRWTQSAKEAVATAYSFSSKVWFTISHGIINEIYYPTIDLPQVRDFQIMVTDEETFFHEEKRHLNSETRFLYNDLVCQTSCADPLGRYKIIKDIIADPYRSCVLIRVRVEAQAAWLPKLKVYALLAPHLEGSGYGNSAATVNVTGKDALVAWKNKTHVAMGTSAGFFKTSCGFVGASDGWQDLKDNFKMDWQFDEAQFGNVSVMGQIDISKSQEFTIAIAFGEGVHAALTTLTQSLTKPFERHLEKFTKQWNKAFADIVDLTGQTGDEGRLYRMSCNLLMTHEDKTFQGAIIASASIPWGQSRGDEDLGGYHLVWTRDLVNSALALLAAGKTEGPLRALVYLACSQRPDGGFPQNFWLDGTPYWSHIQLDQVAYPVILAWRLWQNDALAGFDPYMLIKAASTFLINHGPMTQQERWEENSGYSPSTLAVNITALICAADFLSARGNIEAAQFLQDYADFLEEHIESWTVTTQGTLVSDIKRHYLRILPTDPQDFAPDEDPDHGNLVISNRAPWQQSIFPAKEIVDPGFLELVRYGIRRAQDPLIEDSLRVVDAVLKVETPGGPCWHRYNYDGYGDRPGGGPFKDWGQGRAWPLLTGERGHYELAAGRDVKSYIRAMESFAYRGHMLPEQIWDSPNNRAAHRFLGGPTGAAMPLMWAHAEYIKLLRSASDGQVFDYNPIVAARYLKGRGKKDLEIWKPIRQVRKVAAGKVLRILYLRPFRLRWSVNGWQSFQDTLASDSGLDIRFVDIPLSKVQKAPLNFTFYWLDTDRWEGQNYEIEVV